MRDRSTELVNMQALELYTEGSAAAECTPDLNVGRKTMAQDSKSLQSLYMLGDNKFVNNI